jgi:hypothetical protein
LPGILEMMCRKIPDQTMLKATEAVVLEAATTALDVVKIVFVTKKMCLMPESMILSNERIFPITDTIVSVA